ncbi:TetR/AcrR family transcriptional regulator [Saccharopolyspora erythraea]|uniref:TetR/AcrR family transcriptional regulator n=1 Tax=Saccharopolyspora erythraea TaxID=1836 RepID=UPI002010EA8C|nr:TetR/AcrR family transcriptional regulator [Saccharopolyspora erythraea]
MIEDRRPSSPEPVGGERVSATAPTASQPTGAAKSTRERLLDAAIDIAARHGTHMVTYRSVAAEASVTHGLVRHYFGTREAMLAEAMRVAASRSADDLMRSALHSADFARGMIETLRENRPRHVLRFDVKLNAIRGLGDRRAAVDGYERSISEIAGTLRDLGIADPHGHWAALVESALDGLILQHLLYDSPQRTEGVLRRVRELLDLLASRQHRADAVGHPRP